MTKNDKLDHLAAVRGILRKAHFEAGGDVASWRGRHTVNRDKSRESKRLACRGRGVEREHE
jgi:hypothetical protein